MGFPAQTVQEPQTGFDKCDGEDDIREYTEPVRYGSHAQDSLAGIFVVDSLVEVSRVVEDLVEAEACVDGGEEEESVSLVLLSDIKGRQGSYMIHKPNETLIQDTAARAGSWARCMDRKLMVQRASSGGMKTVEIATKAMP